MLWFGGARTPLAAEVRSLPKCQALPRVPMPGEAARITAGCQGTGDTLCTSQRGEALGCLGRWCLQEPSRPWGCKWEVISSWVGGQEGIIKSRQ